MIKELVLFACFFVIFTPALSNPLGDDDSNQQANIVVPAIAEDDDLKPAETYYRGGYGGGYGYGYRGGYGGYRGYNGYRGYRGNGGRRGHYW